MSAFLTVLQMLAGVVFMVCAVLAWAKMSKRTRHCWRVAYGLIGVSGVALAFGPLFAVPQIFEVEFMRYVRTAILIGFALYIALDRRDVQKNRAPAKARDPDATVPQGKIFALWLVLACLLSAPAPAEAGVIGAARQDDVVILLTDEPCAVEAVGNLPWRVILQRQGASVDGCYAINGPLVVGYFADRRVLLMWGAAFKAAEAS